MRISPLFAVFVVVSLLTLTVCIALIGILISENSKDISASQDAAPEMTGAFSLAAEETAPAIDETQPAATQSSQASSSSVRVTHNSSGSSISSSSTTSSSGNNNQNYNPPIEPDAPAENECLEKYDLSPHTIIFYYTNEPHSNAMKTIVQELQASYTFYWRSTLWDSYFNSCFGTSGATPAFVCAGTNEKIVGEVSKSLLESFAERCA